MAGKGSLMLRRVTRILMFDSSVYEEIKSDPRALWQSVFIVAITGIVAALSSIPESGILGLGLGVVLAFLGWVLFAALAHFFGTYVFRTAESGASWGSVLCTVGYAQTPRFVLVFAIIPVVGPFITGIHVIWLILATIQAVQVSFGYSNYLRAIVIASVAWFFFVVPYFALSTVLLDPDLWA